MSEYRGLGLDWDKIYRLSSQVTSFLVSRVSTQTEMLLIASNTAALAKAILESIIAARDWSDKERSTFWSSIEMELQKHEAIITETMNDRKAKTSGGIENSLGKGIQVESEVSKYTGIDLDWDKIYGLSSEATIFLANKGPTQTEILLIARITAATIRGQLENAIALKDWSHQERSSFWNDIDRALQNHVTLVKGTKSNRTARISGNIEGSLGEQLIDKYKDLKVIATRCGLDEKDILNDIADSMEVANNLTKDMDSLEDSYRWWSDWWYKFLMEWVSKCFVKYVDKSKAWYPHVLYSDYEKMRDLWLSEFEPLWIVGSDIARLSRIDGITEIMTQSISNKADSCNEKDQQKIWRWVNGFNKIALEIFDLFKQKQRKVFDSSLEWLKGHTSDLISAELKRLLSN
jgi:hypothetical protein